MKNETDLIEIEQDRLQALQDLTQDMGDLDRNYGLESLGAHEALDRAYIAISFIDTTLLEHPAIIMQPKWYALARQAQETLATLYQTIGADLPDDPAPAQPSPAPTR